MKLHQLWVSGGAILGASTGCLLVWLVTSTDGPADRQADTTQVASLTAPIEARMRSQTPTGTGESEAHRRIFAPPPSSQSPLDLEALLHHADSAEGEDARRETAARIAETVDEAGYRLAEDLFTALTWALEQDDDMARVALQAVLGEWARGDPAATFEAMSRIADDSAGSALRAYGLAQVVESWAAVDPAAALDAVGLLPSSPGTAFLRSRILTAWAENDPADASASLQTLVNETANAGSELRGLQSAVSNVAYRLARDDGAEAARWALAFPEGTEARTGALAGVVSGWVDDNPEAVSDWLNGMEPGPARDAGVLSMVQVYAVEAPETALAWAQTIADEAQRSSLLGITAARWLSAAPEEAEAWIRTATVLTNGQLEAILAARRTIPEPEAARSSP